MRALIAMSGGVDSSAAVFLMQQQGYECAGAMMRLFSCDAMAEDQAWQVARKLNIPFSVLSFEEAFRSSVIDPFIHVYEQAQTPNPCVFCNQHLKFGALWDRAMEMGFDVLVTGHYARVEQDMETGRYLLKKAVDASKDQSYMLYMLSQKQLAHIRLPLGVYTKEEIRQIAERIGLSNARQKDSQDICFIPDGDYAAFLEREKALCRPGGCFVDPQGRILGYHKGLYHYTIGQRKGLGIASDAPLYVTRLDPETNTVTLSHGEGLHSSELMAEEVHLISMTADELRKEAVPVKARIRYSHHEQNAMAHLTKDGRLHVTFDEPQRAITCGQSVVLYDGEKVVGGGVITEVMHTE